jgi:inner membrane protein involved in colicin E2 resistance
MSAVVYGFALIGAVLTFLIAVGLVLSLVDVRRSRRRHVADGLIAHPAGKGFDQHANEAVRVVSGHEDFGWCSCRRCESWDLELAALLEGGGA